MVLRASTLLTTLLLALLASLVARADVCSGLGNLIPAANCSFASASDLTWWSRNTGTWTYQAGDGRDALGSAQAVSQGYGSPTTQGINLVSPCLTVSPSTTYSFGGFLKWASGSDPDSFQMMLAEYTSSDCSGGSIGPPVSMDPSTSGWNVVSGSQTTDSSAGSARLVVNASLTSTTAFTVLLDDIFVTSMAAGTGVCAMATNVVPSGSCSFASAIDLTWWMRNTGTWTYQAGDGHDALGSAQAASQSFGSPTMQGINLVSPCLTASPSTTYNFGGSLKWASGSDPDSFQMMLAEYPSSDCTGGSIGPPVSMNPSMSGWSMLRGSQATGGSVGSARLVVDVTLTGTTAFTVLLDDIYLVAGPLPVGLARLNVE